jgi:type VI secretion system secreted protein VgrG
VGLTIKAGSNFITIDQSGIAISGTPMVQINSAGAALSGSAGSLVSPLSPTDPAQADKAVAGQMSPPTPAGFTQASYAVSSISPAKKSAASNAPTHDPTSEENKVKTHWIEINLVDDQGKPVAGEPYRVTLPDGTTVADGTLDEKGHARIDHVDPGSCKVTFPNSDKDAWEPK